MNSSILQSTESYSDFWLDQDSINQYIPDEKKGTKEANFSMDLIKLASYRRVISNFVSILTGENIPVQFTMSGDENWTDGKTVWLSSSIKKKTDFDWNVGISLHEGSHILLSDFDIVKLIFNRISFNLKNKAKEKNVSNEQLAYLCKWVFNFIEDRYIDSFIFHEAPGYRGYYKAMYEHLWNSEEISKALKSKMYRKPNLLAYELRVINLTNPNTDLDALVGLCKIAELIDLTNIFRLKTTRDRMELSFQVVEIILDNLGKLPKQPSISGTSQTIDKVTDVIDKYFDLPPGKKLSKNKLEEFDKKNGDKKEETNVSKNNGGTKNDADDPPADTIDTSSSDIDDIIGGIESEAEKPINSGIEEDDEGDTSDFNNKDLKKLREHLENQRKILKHDYRKLKEKISVSEKALLDVIEKSGIILVPTGFGMGVSQPGDYTQAAVDSIVVQKLTKELILSGSDVFPMASVERVPGRDTKPNFKYEEAVNKGWILGKHLGKKLQVRGEINITKFIRKLTGKIERRLLFGIGAGLEDVFTKSIIQKYNRARLHISVDASSSMDTDSKWLPTMTCLTAICVAASMVENLTVSVSFRTTHTLSDGVELPYIVLAYDSNKDKISKVRQIFPYLKPHGCTPEGLAFESTMDKFIIGKKTDGQDHYFLNISDGEPCYKIEAGVNKYKMGFLYNGESAVLHTKRQIEKIRLAGVNVLSYFIKSGIELGNPIYNPFSPGGNKILYPETLGDQFYKMYGKSAKFIDVTNVFDIAKTINGLFLSYE